jgi:hypothetical protein
MALKIKLLVLRMPTLETDSSDQAGLIDDVESAIKNKLQDGYEVIGTVDGKGNLLVILKKDE